MSHKVLEVKQRDVSYSVIHGLYKNRQRLFEQRRTDDPFCSNQACKLHNLEETTEHIFSQCFRIRTAWLWVKEKVMELLSDQGPPPDLSNTELLMLMYPRCRQEAEVVFIICTYMEMVDRDAVSKQKELMVGSVKGVLGAKIEHLSSRAVPELHFPLGWLQLLCAAFRLEQLGTGGLWAGERKSERLAIAVKSVQHSGWVLGVVGRGKQQKTMKRNGKQKLSVITYLFNLTLLVTGLNID